MYEYVTVLPFRLTICLHTQSVHKTWGDGVGVGVTELVTDGVTDGVTELVTDGVTLGVVFDVGDGVGDGVSDGVSDGVGVGDGVSVGVGVSDGVGDGDGHTGHSPYSQLGASTHVLVSFTTLVGIKSFSTAIQQSVPSL